MTKYDIMIEFTGLMILNHIAIVVVTPWLNGVLWGIPAELLKIVLALVEMGLIAGLSVYSKRPPSNAVPSSMYG